MRSAFEAALAEEAVEVRARVVLRAGELDDLPNTADVAERFDVVLLLGVLMYLPDTAQAVARLAEQVKPGGIAALAVRTTTSALWRPAARQDWAAALAAFDEHREAVCEGRDVKYVNELGVPARAVDLDKLIGDAEEHGLRLEQWYGVRIAVDAAELDPEPPADRRELGNLIDVEERLGATEPFRQLGQLALIVFRASGIEEDSSSSGTSTDSEDDAGAA
jgi:SAM-dependent methyltransferase